MSTIPTFLVVGAAKTGTSWLHQCMREHPNVFVPELKEVNFFSWHYDRPDWYRSFFSAREHEEEAGEISPSYMVSEETPKRINDWNPKTKLIFIFRDPVERAYSHYCMLLRAGGATDDIEAEMTKDRRLIQEGLYFKHLNRFREYFSEDQIGCLVFDDLKEEPAEFLQDVYSFLGVKNQISGDMVERKYHDRKARPRSDVMHQAATSLLWGAKHAGWWGARAVHYLRKSRVAGIYNWLNGGNEFPPLPEHKRKELRAFYAKDMERLSSYMNRDLTAEWLQ